jgi:hypothetical protein
MSAPLFTKPKAGKLNPTRNPCVQKGVAEQRQESEQVDRAFRELQWRQAIRPSTRRASK